MTEENRNDDNSTDEVETSTDGNGPQTAEHMDELTDVAVGDDAISRFPEEVQAALVYAEENRYEYGPRLRDAELTWNVVSAEPMPNGIARVRLEYLPMSGFRGQAGTEYMDIDAGGAILARRLIRTPKENRPLVLIGITAFSVALALVLISLMTVFKHDGGDPLYVAGRTLWLRAERPKPQQYIVYKGADTTGAVHTWAMKPNDVQANDLVYIKVTLINQTSGTVSLLVDENAAKLLDGDRTDYDPVNTLDGAYPAEMNQRYLVDDFIPMWGSIKLNENEQVTGMLVYEVPKGSSFSQLRWRATDTAVIHYD
jgi:hypothetical protein